MSIVDTWDWGKIDTSAYDEPIKMTADMKVQTALYDFENHIGIRPNRITMGYSLANELHAMYCPIKTLEEVEREVKGLKVEYEGIPVYIDHANPNNLEVGYMVKWMENKYE